MTEINIKLEYSDIKEFINITSNINCDIDLIKERYIIDAKSIMGILTLDLSKPLKLVIHSNDNDLLNLFSKWITN